MPSGEGSSPARFAVAGLLTILGCGDEVSPDPLATCVGRHDHKPTKLVGGERTMLALFDDGTVYCWGDNYASQCDGTTFQLLLLAPLQVANLPCLTDVAVSRTGLGVLNDGRAIAWGGEATPAPGEAGRPSEVHVLPLRSVSFVYSKDTFQAAVADGKAYHWWASSYPDGTDAPTELPLDGPAERIGGSPGASCYVFGGGSVACRGRNQSGLLGPGVGDSSQPVMIDVGGPTLELMVDSVSACAVRADGEILCWGSNFAGGLGRGGSANLDFDPVPAAILEPGPFVGVAGQGGGACAWRPTGEVFCWGSNNGGRYSVDTSEDPLPRRVPHLEPARHVAVIDERVCALGFDDKIRCHAGGLREVDPNAEPTAEILEFPPPLTLQEQADVASR